MVHEDVIFHCRNHSQNREFSDICPSRFRHEVRKMAYLSEKKCTKVLVASICQNPQNVL